MAYKTHLKQQLGFIEKSCNAYDNGDTSEAIRIATAIRVILHQTRNSTSLLTHLGQTSIHLLSTTAGPSHGAASTAHYFDGMVVLAAVPTDFRTVSEAPKPKLGQSSSPHTFLTVDDWLNQSVMVITGIHISRRSLILVAANKDGGAHVDTVLPPEYDSLKSGFWIHDSTGTLISDHHALCLRQVGYELLNSPELLSLTQ